MHWRGPRSTRTPRRGLVSAKQAVNEGAKYRLGVTTIRVIKIEPGPHGGPISENPLQPSLLDRLANAIIVIGVKNPRGPATQPPPQRPGGSRSMALPRRSR